MEKYLGWIIDEKNVTGWLLSDGQVKLEADVYPNAEELYKFLQDNDIVSTPFASLLSYVQNMHRRSNFYHSLSCDEEQDMTILNAVAAYCNMKRYKTTKTAHAFLSISSTGNNKTRARAMNKIKEWVRDSLPNPRQGIIDFLKEKRLISLNVNPFCEILSKDI